MSDVKLLRGNVTITFALPEAVEDWAKPTSAELNDMFDWTDNAGGMNHNLSCAIEDGYTLGMTDPATDATRTICDVANVETPTYDNYEASFNFLRDKDVKAPGLFNMARSLFLGAGRRFWVIERVGVSWDTPFAPGQTISMYEVETDWPITLTDDNTPLRLTTAFKATGNLHINYILEV